MGEGEVEVVEGEVEARLGPTPLCSPDIIDVMNYARPSPFFTAPYDEYIHYPCRSRLQS